MSASYKNFENPVTAFSDFRDNFVFPWANSPNDKLKTPLRN